MKPIILVVSILLFTSCSPSEKAMRESWDKKHRIRLFDCGQVIGEWECSISPERGQYVSFIDSKTGLTVTVRGTVVIEEIK